MDVRERLVEMIHKAIAEWEHGEIDEKIADYLITHGVTITPAVPGPEIADPNIMELCFHNGERHMKEKVRKELTRLAEHMPCITLAQALAMLDGL